MQVSRAAQAPGTLDWKYASSEMRPGRVAKSIQTANGAANRRQMQLCARDRRRSRNRVARQSRRMQRLRLR